MKLDHRGGKCAQSVNLDPVSTLTQGDELADFLKSN